MMTNKNKACEYQIKGQKLSEKDIEQIKEIVGMYPRLDLQELVRTICVIMHWNAFVKTEKEQTVEQLLYDLADGGIIQLRNQRKQKPSEPKGGYKTSWYKKREIEITEQTKAAEDVTGIVNNFYPVSLELVSDTDKEALWDEYVERYHELKYGSPFGNRIKYFITISGENPQYAGCLLFSASSWALEERDKLIGWEKEERKQRLHLIVNNSRFLIFPWIKIKNLASYALGESARRIRKDWLKLFKYEPVLLETFVDGAKYSGGCYTAANWIYVGDSKGRGRHAPRKKYVTSSKKIYLYPLVKDFRDYLTGKKQGGEIL